MCTWETRRLRNFVLEEGKANLTEPRALVSKSALLFVDDRGAWPQWCNEIKCDSKHSPPPPHVHIVQTFDRRGKLHRMAENSSRVRDDENKIGGKKESHFHRDTHTRDWKDGMARACAIKTVNVSGAPLLQLYIICLYIYTCIYLDHGAGMVVLRQRIERYIYIYIHYYHFTEISSTYVVDYFMCCVCSPAPPTSYVQNNLTSTMATTTFN